MVKTNGRKVVKTTIKRTVQKKRKPARTRNTTRPQGKAITSARTTAQVEKDLKTVFSPPRASVMKGMDDWSMCRLNPWSANMKGAILPDGSGDPRFSIDLYSYTDIASTSPTWSAQLQILPTLPYCAMFIPTQTANYTLTGPYMMTGTWTGANGGMHSFVGNINAGLALPINGTKAVTTYLDDPYSDNASAQFISANKARIISMGWRLVYTGPANACTGVVTVSSNPTKTDPPFFKSTGTLTWNNAVGVATDVGNTATNPARCLPITFGAAYASKDSVSDRPEATLMGLVRHSSPVYNWQDLYEQPLCLTYQVPGSNQNATAIYSYPVGGGFTPIINTATVTHGTISLFDDGWDAVNIMLNSVTGTFRLETWQCLEYIPQPESIYYDIAKVSNLANTQLVTSVNKAASEVPIAHSAKDRKP
jgi:hypothetical protein